MKPHHVSRRGIWARGPAPLGLSPAEKACAIERKPPTRLERIADVLLAVFLGVFAALGAAHYLSR
jgi:hypothetical protein